MSRCRLVGLDWHARQSANQHRMEVLMLGRLPMLAEVGNVAAMMASDHASPLAATVVNLSCGEIAD